MHDICLKSFICGFKQIMLLIVGQRITGYARLAKEAKEELLLKLGKGEK